MNRLTDNYFLFVFSSTVTSIYLLTMILEGILKRSYFGPSDILSKPLKDRGERLVVGDY